MGDVSDEDAADDSAKKDKMTLEQLAVRTGKMVCMHANRLVSRLPGLRSVNIIACLVLLNLIFL